MKKLTMNQIMDEIKPGKEYLVYLKTKNYNHVIIVDGENHLLRLYKVVHEYPKLLERVEIDFEALAERLAPGLDKVALIMDVLVSAAPEEILEVQERLEHPEASVKGGPGCFSILIGGKPGRPFELRVRE